MPRGNENASRPVDRHRRSNDSTERSCWRGPPLRSSRLPTSLIEALRKARRAHGGSRVILQDQNNRPISYNRMLLAIYALGRRIARDTSPNETIGIFLPTSVPAIIVYFAVLSAGRVPALLNHQAGVRNLRMACTMAKVKRVIASKRFIKAAKLEDVVASLESSVSFLHGEDLRQTVTLPDRIAAAARLYLPLSFSRSGNGQATAAILFTSGTTGTPKGVVLTHANLLANIEQCRNHIPFDVNWIFFNALPIFHAFGLTAGTLLPVLSGMKTVLYPSPLDRKNILQMLATTGANVLISTDTFARLYARAARDELKDLQYVVLGGERINETTKRHYAEKSSAVLLQGYGATECSPVIAINQPEANRPDTVGTLLPGIEACLEPVEGIDAGQRLLVRGPNVMAGYLDPDHPGELATREEWFDTGDLAERDEEGYLSVTGRIKRFARIGAEMVSLEAIEDHARSIWPDGHHAAMPSASSEKGEKVVLVTDQADASRPDFAAWAHSHDVSRLAVPAQVVVVPELPLLATGKPDYQSVRNILEEKSKSANPNS